MSGIARIWSNYGRSILGGALGLAMFPAFVAVYFFAFGYGLFLGGVPSQSQVGIVERAVETSISAAALGTLLFVVALVVGYAFAAALHGARHLLSIASVPPWIAALVGGWTAIGMIGLPAVINYRGSTWSWIAAILAVALAQSMAVVNLRLATQAGTQRASLDGLGIDMPRFRMRRLLELTAGLAVIAALATFVPKGELVLGVLLASTIVQAAIVVAWLALEGRRPLPTNGNKRNRSG